MRVTVLGKSPAWQDAGGACSGYLIEDGETRLLLDCGNGVFAKLRERCDYRELSGVAISHMHADHFFDLVSYAHALLLSPRGDADGSPRPRLAVPPGGDEVLRSTTELWGNQELIDAAFAVEEYDPAAGLEIGTVRLRFAAVPHYVPTYAIDVSSAANGSRLTFSADCRPNDALVELARETDLLIIEATLPRPESGPVRGHLTATEAGEHARRAGARRVLLTHVSDELDGETVREQGEEAFGREVEVARAGATYEVSTQSSG